MTSGDLVRGTLDMLILKTLTWGPMHGYAIARWLEQATDDVLRVEEGSLYPALHRMARRGWVRAEWGLSDNNRQARYYTLTADGKRRLHAETAVWQSFTAAVGTVLEMQPE